MALLNQELGETGKPGVESKDTTKPDTPAGGYGNLNPLLYSLYTVDKGDGTKAVTNAFHDVTPAIDDNCDLATPSPCNNSTPGKTGVVKVNGYALTAGYDQVTGLGSLDVANFIKAAVDAAQAKAAADANLPAPPEIRGTVLTLTTPVYNIPLNQCATITATLSSNISVGTVQFYSLQSGSTSIELIGTAVNVVGGAAACPGPFPSTGVYTIGAVYSGVPAIPGTATTAAVPGYAASTAKPLVVAVIPSAVTPSATTLSLVLKDGDNQSVALGQQFKKLLQVQVLDQSKKPVSGAMVFFTAPSLGSGASAVVPLYSISGAQGIASVNAVANSTAGSYTVTASIEPDASQKVSFSLTNSDLPEFVVNTTEDNDTNGHNSPYGNKIGTAENCDKSSGGNKQHCTLRDALAATVAAGNAKITFDPMIFGGTYPMQTITLKSGLDLIPKDVVLPNPTKLGSFPSLAVMIIGPALTN